jgi:hypothetical protein
MPRRHVIVALVVATLAFSGWAWAQTRIQGPQAPQAPLLGGGPFAVSSVGQSAILVDTSSGKTWELTHSVDGQAVWLPGKRIDSEKEAEEWRQHNRQQIEEQRRNYERKGERKRLDNEDLAPVPVRPASKE